MKSKLTKRILAVACVALVLSVLFALTSFAAEIKFEGTTFTGLDESKTYTVAPYTVLGADTANEKSVSGVTSYDITTDFSAPVGLYGISDGTDTVVGYVYGTYANLIKVGTFENGSTKPSAEVKASEEWAIGMFRGVKNSGSAIKSGKGYTFLDDWSYSISAKDLINAGSDATKVAAAKADLIAKLQSKILRYAYAPDEIFPISQFKTVTVGSYNYSGTGHPIRVIANPKVYVYVMAEDGSVSEHIWTGNKLNQNGHSGWTDANSYPVKIQDIQGIPTEGWVVGIKYQPMADIDPKDLTISGTSTTSNYATNTLFGVGDYYVVDKPKAEAPVGITVEGTVFKGLDANTTYAVAPYTIVGADDSVAKEITGVSEYDIKSDFASPSGLYGIYVKGDANYANSDAVIIYVMNKFADMATLGEYKGTTDKTPVRDGTKEAVLEWNPGTYLAASAWASSSFRANDMYSVCLAKTLNDALATADPDDEKVLRENALATMRTISTRYAYAANEIIPINQVKTMKFMAGQQNIVLTVKDAKPKVELYVMHSDNSVTVHTWIGDGFSYMNNSVDMGQISPQIVDVQSIAGLPSDGWLVGFKYYPIWEVELENINPIMTTSNGAFSLYMRVPTLCHPNYYEIEQAQLDAPTSITVEGTVFKGLDETVTYAIAPYTYAGADADNLHKFTGVTEFDLTNVFPEPAGLYALVIPGDEYYKESAPTLVYIAGPSDKRKAIGVDKQFNCEGYVRNGYVTYANNTQYGTGSVYDRVWIPGLYSGYRNYYSTGGGYHFFVCDWYGRGSVKSAADLMAALATEDPSDELEIRKGYRAFLQKQALRYVYLSEEIIPVDEIFTMTFSPFRQHGAVTATVKAKLTVYVMDENGVVTEHSALGSKYTPNNAATGQKFDVQAIEGLPSEGWVVGFEFMPAAEVELEDITSTSNSTATGLEIAIIWGQDNYEIKEEAPTPPLSSFPVIPGGYGEVSGLDATVLYEYQLYDEETDTWSDWAPIPAGATAFKVTEAGTYKVRAKETDRLLASIPAEITVLTYDPEYPGFDSQIITMHLPNDFVELTAEYEMDVTVKNWVSTLALSNIKTVSPDSVITLSGDGYKFVVKAEKINLEGNKAHYIDMTVAFDGESRFDKDYEGLKALAGEKYVKEVHIESTTALPFEEAEFMIFVGDDQSGNDVQLRSYNRRINKLRNVEASTVVDGWVTFTNYAMTYVIITKN